MNIPLTDPLATNESGRAPGVASLSRAEPTHVVENRTARRIAIDMTGSELPFVLPPFGSRRIRRSILTRLRLEHWESSGLVRLEDPAREDPHAGVLASGVVIWTVILALVAAVVRPSFTHSWIFWALPGVIATGATAVAAVQMAHAHEAMARAVDRFYRWCGVLVVSLIGFGLPWLVLASELRSINPVNGLAPELYLTIFIAFVGLLSTLPALLFYLFDQQQKDTVRREFFREIMRLSPSMQSTLDAETAYGPLVDEVYGERKPGTVFNLSAVPVLISTLLLTLGWTATLLPKVKDLAEHMAHDDTALAALLVPYRSEFTFAFLGAYFFTLNMVFRRYVRADLGPKAYSHISIRIIIASVLSWVAAVVPQFAGTPSPAWVLLILVFFFGLVPETGLALFHDLLISQQRWIGLAFPSIRERDPLSNLEGITLYDRARLLEEGIENIENLAHHDLPELMLRTRIPTPRLVDLVDQSILYLHARDADPAVDGVVLPRLKRIGIRTATDLECVARTAAPAFQQLLGDDGGVQRISTIQSALADDEWMIHLRHWRQYLSTYNNLYSFDSFFPAQQVTTPPVA